jgi:hypothetical protein
MDNSKKIVIRNSHRPREQIAANRRRVSLFFQKMQEINDPEGNSEGLLDPEPTQPIPLTEESTQQEIHIKLTPFSDSTTPPPTIVQLVDRNLKDGMAIKLGRQVFRDGKLQTKASDHGLDIWFTSKVVSRNHAEMWAKDGQVSP